MRIDLSAVAALQVGGHDVAEVTIAGRRLWPRTDPLVSRLAGVGYAGSIYQVTHAGAGRWQYDTGSGWTDFAPAQMGAVLMTGLAQDGAAISWLRDDGNRSNAFARLWTPYAMPGLAGLFDIRRVAAGAASWAASAGGMSYNQPNAGIRPVYEAAGLEGHPCFFSDWDRRWVITGLPAAPRARTFMGLFSFLTTDVSNWYTPISGPAGSWALYKSYPSAGKRRLAVGRSGAPFTDWHESALGIVDNTALLVTAKVDRLTGEFGFRFNGLPAGSGTSAVLPYTDTPGTSTMSGYIRLGSHAYVDTLVSDATSALFEGWCAWTQGFVALLPTGHQSASAPPAAL